MARLWRDAANRRGGTSLWCICPSSAFGGNTHFPFSDLNNREIADLMSEFLETKKLDQ